MWSYINLHGLVFSLISNTDTGFVAGKKASVFGNSWTSFTISQTAPSLTMIFFRDLIKHQVWVPETLWSELECHNFCRFQSPPVQQHVGKARSAESKDSTPAVLTALTVCQALTRQMMVADGLLDISHMQEIVRYFGFRSKIQINRWLPRFHVCMLITLPAALYLSWA